MDNIKAIRTEEDYNAALELMESLIDRDPEVDSEDGDKLSILAVLIEKYEADNFPDNLPDPIDAIKFRMDQLDLKPVDLEPYIGSTSRVSEILSGKRPLTLEMVRSLEEGLGIPAEALLKKPESNEEDIFNAWDKRLANEMEKRGYFHGIASNNMSDKLKSFFSTSAQLQNVPSLLRQSNYRSAPTTDKYALAAWSTRVLSLVEQENVTNYTQKAITMDFMRQVAQLSVDVDGPVKAKTLLASKGVSLIIEPHLPKTRLDGAVLMADNGKPVIGLTLRHDRIDNFWFTLMHELAHIALHFDDDTEAFFDELDSIKGLDVGRVENEADALASEALVPANKWAVSPARILPAPMAARSLANELNVDVAIIAGKIRFETGNWGYLNTVLKNKTVRQFFPGHSWETK